MRFPLDKQNVIGYDYGVPTTYNSHHLGVDWEADFVPLYAPKNGSILATLYGPEGGYDIWFRPDGEKIILRWLHLSKFLVKAGQHVIEGQQVAITGDSGTDGNGHHPKSHLHEDMWPGGKITLNFKDTLNPHDYYKKGEKMQLVNDKGTKYIITGNKDKRKIGLADLESLGLLGDEPQVDMDTSGIPEYNTIVKAKTITHK